MRGFGDVRRMQMERTVNELFGHLRKALDLLNSAPRFNSLSLRPRLPLPGVHEGVDAGLVSDIAKLTRLTCLRRARLSISTAHICRTPAHGMISDSPRPGPIAEWN